MTVIRTIDKIPDDLRKTMLDEVYKDSAVWGASDIWCTDKYPYFVKNKTCVPLIAGKQDPYVRTPFYDLFPTITSFLVERYGTLTRINLQKVNPLSKYPMHVDEGAYFVDKDRYALCLQSPYKLIVCGSSTRVSPGDVVWFDNKKPHEAINLGSKERIAVVFDVPKENGCKS